MLAALLDTIRNASFAIGPAVLAMTGWGIAGWWSGGALERHFGSPPQIDRGHGRPGWPTHAGAGAAERAKRRSGALGEAGASGHTVLAAGLGNRAGFAHAFARGLGVTEAARSGRVRCRAERV